MTSDYNVSRDSRSLLPFLGRVRTIVKPGYSKWMARPGILFAHLCVDGPRDER
jgi:hypothetical protein